MIVPNIVAGPAAERMFNFLNTTSSTDMPADWWHYAFHAPFSTERCITANEIAITDNKRESLKEFRSNRIAYQFRRTVGDHFSECPCPICETTMLFESDAFLDYVGSDLGYAVDLATCFASYYAPGDYLSIHTDKGNGEVAFVWNLTKDWKPQFGGALHLLDKKNWDHVETVISPSFNELVMFDVDGEGLPHFVSHVAPTVTQKRLAFSGWFKRIEHGGDRKKELTRRRDAHAREKAKTISMPSPVSAKKFSYKDIEGTFMFPQFYSRLVREEAPRVFVEQGRPMRFVEVGVYKGQSVAYFIEEAIAHLSKEAIPEIHLVDLGLENHGALRNLEPVRHMIKNSFDMASVEAAERYGDRYFDVVFIDADHAYESVRDDIRAWLPKVRPGGIIAGHDFANNHPGVMRAVMEAFQRGGFGTGALTLEPGERWNEKLWKTVSDHDSASEHIPVWWVRLPGVTAKIERVSQEVGEHKMFRTWVAPDLNALQAEIDRAGDYTLKRIHARSKAYDGGFGTNVPLLAAVLGMTNGYFGDVLELGAGNFSTPLMAEMCRAMNRKLITIDSNPTWAENFADIQSTRVIDNDTLTSWENAIASVFHGMHFSVALVDMAAGSDRAGAISFLRDKATFIVVHDTYNAYFRGVDEALATFKHRYDYTAMCPTTTVVSMTNKYPGGI